jgi:hypothetical protein
MSKHLVTFIGQPVPAGKDAAHFKKDSPDRDSVTFRGVEFPLGKPVAIDAQSASAQAMIAKLKANSHFTVEDAVDAEPKPADATSAPAPDHPHPEAMTAEAEAKRAERAAKKAAKA